MTWIRIHAVWCMSCLVMYPIIEELKQEYPNIKFLDYDYDRDIEMVNTYEVGNILPVHILLKDGKEVVRLIGEKKKQSLINLMKEVS